MCHEHFERLMTVYIEYMCGDTGIIGIHIAINVHNDHAVDRLA